MSPMLYYIIIGLGVICGIHISTFLIKLLTPNLDIINKNITVKYNLFLLNTNLGDAVWFAYLGFFSILIYLNLKQSTSFLGKYGVSFLYVCAIIIPMFPLLSVINNILNIFIKNPPFIYDRPSVFPASLEIEKNYKNIRSEYENYEKNNEKIGCLYNINPSLHFEKTESKDNCWRTLHLKLTGKMVPGMDTQFPITSSLITDPQIHNAFFSILDPGVEITPHVGYFKGYYRYHLGVIIPEIDGKKPYITVSNEKYEWSNGEGVIFDDMYVHYVKNPTNMKRVVLYLDVKRKGLNPVLQTIVNVQSYVLETSTVLQYFIKNEHVQQKVTHEE